MRRSIFRVRLVQADRRAAKYPGLINAVLRRVAREGAELIATLDAVPLDTPAWLFERWTQDLRRGDRARDRDRARPRAAARSHREGRRRKLGAAPARPRACRPERVRTDTGGLISLLPGYHEGAWWVQDAAAALPARLFGDVARQARRRPLRRARRQDRAARAGGRARDRGRPLGQPAGARARKSRAARPARRHDRRRRHRMAGRAVRRRAGRRALLVHRHDPPPSRRRLAQERDRYRAAHRAAASPARPRGRADQAGRHRSSIAFARSSRRKASSRSRRCSPASRASAASRLRPARSPESPNSSIRMATCARCRAIGPIRTRGWAASTASSRPVWSGFNSVSSARSWPDPRADAILPIPAESVRLSEGTARRCPAAPSRIARGWPHSRRAARCATSMGQIQRAPAACAGASRPRSPTGC